MVRWGVVKWMGGKLGLYNVGIAYRNTRQEYRTTLFLTLEYIIIEYKISE